MEDLFFNSLNKVGDYQSIYDGESVCKSVTKNIDKDAKWEFQIKATNILNIDKQVRNSSNNLSVFNSITIIQPRFITFRGVFNL